MMTDRDKHLSLALDALVQLTESIDDYHLGYREIPSTHHWRQLAGDAKVLIEAAAMPKPSMIRRWFGRREAA